MRKDNSKIRKFGIMNNLNARNKITAKNARRKEKIKKYFADLCVNFANSAVKSFSLKTNTKKTTRDNQKIFAVLCVNLCDLCG